MKAKRLVQNESTKNDPVIERMPAACSDEGKAVAFMEELRWGDHPACPLCGDLNVYKMTGKDGARAAGYRWRCRGCKQMYSVRKGTVMEDSAIPFRHWCFAFWRASASKKGVSALEIHRYTGVSYKSALFLMNRIRYAMEAGPGPLSGIVEVDETYVGGKPRYKGTGKTGRGTKKTPVLAMVERGGRVRAQVLPNITAKTLTPAVVKAVHHSARIYTDEYAGYNHIGRRFKRGHETVAHGKREYARGDVHTNTIEGFFSILKRGINGIYHAVSKKHLHRYLSEFTFRYSNRELGDGARVALAVKQADGKRLMYSDVVAGVK